MEFAGVKAWASERWQEAGPVTRALLGVLLLLNIVVLRLPQWAIDLALISEHTFDRHLHEVAAALLLDGLIVIAMSTKVLAFIVVICVWVWGVELGALWRNDPRSVWQPVALIAACTALLELAVPGRGMTLAFFLMATWRFGAALEGVLGSGRLLALVLTALLISSLMLALMMQWYDPVPFILRKSAPGTGFQAMFEALLVGMAVFVGHEKSPRYPISGLQVVWWLTALSLYDLFFSNHFQGARSLAAILVARLMIEGGWDPRTWPGWLANLRYDLGQGWRRLAARFGRGRGDARD